MKVQSSPFSYLFNRTMKKCFGLSILLFIGHNLCFAQNKFTDSLSKQLAIVKKDTSRVLILSDLCFYYRNTNVDSSIVYGHDAWNLAQKIKFVRGEADVLSKLGLSYREKGDLPKSLELLFRAMKIAQDNRYFLILANAYRRIAHVYRDLSDYQKSLAYSHLALENDLRINNKRGIATEYMNFAITYQHMNNPDSASYYGEKAYEMSDYIEDLKPEVFKVLGDVQAMKNIKNKAAEWYHKGIQQALSLNDFRTTSFIYSNMAGMYRKFNIVDSAIICAEQGVLYGQKTSYQKGILLSANLLSQIYDSIDPVKALEYHKIAAAAKDSLFGAGNIQTIQALVSKEETRQKELESTKSAYQNRLRLYGLSTGLAVFLIIALILYRNNRQKQKTNKILEATLLDLKTTQSQLILSEKMASLGELTAGIAHEIQNPLNFVNNFSELNKELLLEMKDEIEKGNLEDAKSLAANAIDNQEKINHHGKRADAIVRGMLQHSRSSTGIKEVTDINALCDEYLRLSYHGYRAKDNTFNSTLNTNYDKTIGPLNIIPQDIGRVILNLINNAFYAVQEKKAKLGNEYSATVSLNTKKSGDNVLISIKDNGNGIPQNILDKIFQPFFTTKPAGQGTGLGLSLSYDIVKAHGGELKVQAQEGEGSEFIIQLSVS
jgi:two-component system, NtrC family, sensor kinase